MSDPINPDVMLARMMALVGTVREFHVEGMRAHTIDDEGIDDVEVLLEYIDKLHEHIVAGGTLPQVWEKGPRLDTQPDALRMLGKLEEKLGTAVLQERLDDVVHDLKSKEASDINNSSDYDQWSWVVRQLGLDEARRAVTGGERCPA